MLVEIMSLQSHPFYRNRPTKLFLFLLVSTAWMCCLAMRRSLPVKHSFYQHHNAQLRETGALIAAARSSLGGRETPTRLHLGNKFHGNDKKTYQAKTSTRNYGSSITKPDRFVHPQVLKMFRRAQFLIRQGDNGVAKKLLERCLELNPYDSHSWLALARLEAKVGNIENARSLFQKGDQKCPDNIHILHAWGHLEQKHDNVEKAREYWSRALKLDPLNAYVCHALSNLEKRMRNYDRAGELLRDVVHKKPTAAICVSLAELERHLGNPEVARDVLLRGLDRCTKELSKVLLALAWLEEDAFGRVEAGAKYVDQAMAVDSDNIRVYVAKASLLLRQERVDEARRVLKKATELKSEDAQHYTMWSTLELEASGDMGVETARGILEEGAKRYPGDRFLLQRWGTLEARSGNTDKARALFKKSVLIQPHAPTFVAWAILEESEGIAALNKATLDLSKAESMSASEIVSHLQPPSPTTTATATVTAADDFTTNDDAIRGVIDSSSTSSTGARPSISKFKSGSDMDTLELKEMKYPTNGISEDAQAGDTAAAAAAKVDAKEFARQKFDESRHLFALGMEVDPYHGPLYHAYGNSELRRRNITGARDIFRKGIDKNCTDVTSLYHALGLLEAKDNNRLAAGEIFRKGIELGLKGNREVDPGVGFLLHSLGMLELDGRRLLEAQKVFATGISLFPNHSQMLLGQALVSMKLGEHEKARLHFRLSVDADATHLHAWQCWAIAEKQFGNIELARVLFREGLKHGPMHGALWQGYAVMEMQQGNSDIARSLFAQAVRRAPTHAQSYQAWACLEVRLNNLPQAKALTWEGIRRAPSHAALWTVAGLIEERLGDTQRAREILMTGIERFPGHGALYKVLGELEEKHQAYAAARAFFSDGLKHDPYYAPVYHAAALLEAKLGNLENLSELHYKAKTYFTGPTTSSSDSLMDTSKNSNTNAKDCSSSSISAETSDDSDGSGKVDNAGTGLGGKLVDAVGGNEADSRVLREKENEDIIERIQKLEKLSQDSARQGKKLSEINFDEQQYDMNSDSFILNLGHQ
mmetsp:Transcript_14148/g.23536  ORF Transcript_14148/g.23536 Transcript_14148/m.23536 type:complete len:1046 (-) Transcript_14148:183-3320(-)